MLGYFLIKSVLTNGIFPRNIACGEACAAPMAPMAVCRSVIGSYVPPTIVWYAKRGRRRYRCRVRGRGRPRADVVTAQGAVKPLTLAYHRLPFRADLENFRYDFRYAQDSEIFKAGTTPRLA